MFEQNQIGHATEGTTWSSKATPNEKAKTNQILNTFKYLMCQNIKQNT